MMQPEQMTGLQRIEELEARVQVLEQTITQLKGMWQTLVKEELQVVTVEAVNRIVGMIQVQWKQEFLPELRRTVQADVKETLQSGGENVSL